MIKTISYAVEGALLASLFSGFYEVFLIGVILLILMRVPLISLMVAFVFDLAFGYQYFSVIFPASVMLFILTVLAKFVRDKFVW